MTDHESLRVGSIINGEYRICGLLRHASTGFVFRAEQLTTGAFRAIKVLAPELVEDAGSRARFEREARLSASISSEHVEQVLDAGVDTDTGLPWIALELLTGETLADHVAKKGPLDLATASMVLEQLCHALAAAHAVGIVHRDLTPSNVLLAQAKRAGAPFLIKILDFGLAKILSAGPVSSATVIGGNPLWVAPEQLANVPIVSSAVDVWTLGLITFHMLTGLPFWKGGVKARLPDLFDQLVRAPLPRASARAAELGVGDRLDPALDAFFDGCFRREQTERHASAAVAYEVFRAGAAEVTVADDAGTVVMTRPPEIDSLRAPADTLVDAEEARPVALPLRSAVFGAPPEVAPAVAATASAAKRPRRSAGIMVLGAVVVLCLIANGALIVDRLQTRGSARIAQAHERLRTPAPAPAARGRIVDEPVAEAAPPPPTLVWVSQPHSPLGYGKLSVICDPACDDVRVDGRSLGESPVFKRTVAAGERSVRLRWSNPRQERTVRVHVSPGADPTVVRQQPPSSE